MGSIITTWHTMGSNIRIGAHHGIYYYDRSTRWDLLLEHDDLIWRVIINSCNSMGCVIIVVMQMLRHVISNSCTPMEFVIGYSCITWNLLLKQLYPCICVIKNSCTPWDLLYDSVYFCEHVIIEMDHLFGGEILFCFPFDFQLLRVV